MSGPETGNGVRATWLAGLVVAAGAAVLTAHGAIEVALGSGVGSAFGWLYPVITDGLALVAYAATTRLAGTARGYAWSIVVLAAGLSGLAQASYLAGGVAQAAAPLRFGVGAWPAVAAAIAAHLLYLIGAHQPSGDTAESDDESGGTGLHPENGDIATSSPRPNGSSDGVQPVSCGVHSGCPTGVQPAVHSVRVEQLESPPPRSEQRASDTTTVHNNGRWTTPGHNTEPRTALSAQDRARVVAELLRAQHGQWPSVRELAEHADVARGTAATALNELRERPEQLHVITDDDHATPGS